MEKLYEHDRTYFSCKCGEIYGCNFSGSNAIFECHKCKNDSGPCKAIGLDGEIIKCRSDNSNALRKVTGFCPSCKKKSNPTFPVHGKREDPNDNGIKVLERYNKNRKPSNDHLPPKDPIVLSVCPKCGICIGHKDEDTGKKVVYPEPIAKNMLTKKISPKIGCRRHREERNRRCVNCRKLVKPKTIRKKVPEPTYDD